LGASQQAGAAQQLFGRQLRTLRQRSLQQRTFFSQQTGSQAATHTLGASQTFTGSQHGVGQQLLGRQNRTLWQRVGKQVGSQAGAQAGSQAAGAQAFTASQQPPSRLAFALLAVEMATRAAITSAGNKIRRYMSGTPVRKERVGYARNVAYVGDLGPI
jgi:hypothetical protein